jgi:hypothetical protein
MSSTKKASVDKLLSTLASEFNSVEKNIIYQGNDGCYYLFKKYTIQKDKTGFLVMRTSTRIGIFYSLKNAFGWCIADKYGKHDLAHSFKNIDWRTENARVSIHHMKHLAGKTLDSFRHAVLNDRIDFEEKRLSSLQYASDKNISDAKYIQTRGFLNETSRI